MAPHSSTFAWKLPWTEKPGRLQSMGSLESDTTERLHFHFSLSCTGEGNGDPLQCSCLENHRDGKPGGLPSMGSHRVGHDWSDLAAAAASLLLFCFQGKPFNITVNQIYAPTSNAEEAEVEQFYEDVQDILELTPKKDVLFIIGDWNAKLRSQETPGVTGKFGLRNGMKQGKD